MPTGTDPGAARRRGHRRRGSARLILLSAILLLPGCFATLQTARINTGLHSFMNYGMVVDEGYAAGGSGHRFVERSDHLLESGIKYGHVFRDWGNRGIEFGLSYAIFKRSLSRYSVGYYNPGEPLGMVFTPTKREINFFLPYYLKLAGDQTKRLKGALLLQGPFPVVFLPYRAGVILSYARGNWEPYLSVSYLHPYRMATAKRECIGEGSSRYDKDGRRIFILALGIDYRPGDRFGLLAEIGLFNNNYTSVTDKRLSTRDLLFSGGISF